MSPIARRLLAEALGTALLLAVVIGSGIMAERLAQGNAAVALLANTLATVAGLYVLIELFAPLSGAHFNPVVSLVQAACGRLARPLVLPYAAAQCAGAVAGVWLAHAMFGAAIWQVSAHVRSGAGQWLAEGVATFGLVLVVLRAAPARAAALVAAWIGAAYWFTASTAFANPAGALGRALSDSFAGIAPTSVPAFIAGECAGAAAAYALHRWFGKTEPAGAAAADSAVPTTASEPLHG